MALSSFTIQQIFEVRAFDLVSGDLLLFSDNLKSASVENAEETVYSMGGVGNVYINGDSHSKRTTINTEAATFDMSQVSMITGSPVVTGATTVNFVEILTVGTNAATTTHTATGTVGAEIISLQELDASGNVVKAYDQVASAPTTGKFTYTSGTKALTFFATDMAAGKLIRVVYNVATGTEAMTVTNATNVFAGQAKFIFETIVKDACGTIYAAQLVVYKAKINGTWSFDLAADGEPAVLAMNLEALKACGQNKLWDLKIYDESALV